jgi:hypothetical protein
MLAMVVVSPVEKDPANPEEALELLEASAAPLTLNDHEPMRHLIAGRVACSAHPTRLPNEADGEASFSVYETDDPADPDQPFLLIVRTRHVVTTVNALSDVTVSSAGSSDIPAYSRLHRRDYSRRGQRSVLSGITSPKRTCHLRTVIVTAAVYRGLVSKLRLAANLST